MGLSISNNVASMRAQSTFQLNTLKLNNTLRQLSTGLRINRGADDPAGLIASEALRSEIRAIDAAMENAAQTDMVLSTAEGGMREISGVLVDMKGLAVAANNSFLSNEERAALQMQMGASLDAIDRIAGSTRFAGRPLLDGSATFTLSPDVSHTASVDIQGVSTGTLGQVSDGAGGYHSLSDLTSGGPLDLLSGDVGKAAASIDRAISQVATQRGRIGAFQRNTIAPAVNSLAVARENATAAESTIRDTAFARATASLARDSILIKATACVLSIANSRANSVLSLFKT